MSFDVPTVSGLVFLLVRVRGVSACPNLTWNATSCEGNGSVFFTLLYISGFFVFHCSYDETEIGDIGINLALMSSLLRGVGHFLGVFMVDECMAF